MAHIVTLSLWLPFPPSVNALWRSVGNRVMTSRNYKEWKREAANSLSVQVRNAPVFGAYELQVKIARRRKGSDCDNRIKPVNDALQVAGVIMNDKLCTRAAVEWSDDTGTHDCLVVVSGEIAFANQWDYAKHKATSRKRRPGRR